MRALNVPFLRFPPRGPVLPKGTNEAAIEILAANDAHFYRVGSRRVVEDYEIDRLAMRLRRGVGKGTDITLELPFLSRGGGILDPFISFWHELVFFAEAEFRDRTAFGKSDLEFRGRKYGAAAGIGDIGMSITKQVDPRLWITIGTEAPTGRSAAMLGSGAWDFGGALQWHIPVNHRMDWHAQFGYVRQGRSGDIPGVREDAVQGSVSFSYRQNSRDAYIAQWQAEGTAIRTGIDLADSSHRMVTIAYRRTIADRSFLEAFLAEDGDFINYAIPEFANLAPDLTLGLRYIHRF